MNEVKDKAMYLSTTNEWGTPPEIIECVHKVFDIELDPASNEVFNKTVKAKRIFTFEDNGMSKNWSSKSLFLNPPYGREVGYFVNRLCDQFDQGYVDEAILLINSNTSTTYYQNALFFSSALCLPSTRIAFIDAQGIQQTSPRYSNSVFYFGDRYYEFSDAFEHIGHVILTKSF